jgi:hypothetical protein
MKQFQINTFYSSELSGKDGFFCLAWKVRKNVFPVLMGRLTTDKSCRRNSLHTYFCTWGEQAA